MVSLSRRALALAAVAVGVAGGTAAALATTSQEPQGPPARADGVVVVRAKPPPAPRRPSVDSLPLVVDAGSVALEQRVGDPRGGPDWAVRTFVADVRRVEFGDRTFAETETVGRTRCVQLGRIVDGAFGWLDAQRRFRAVAPGEDGGVLDRSGLLAADGTSAREPTPLHCSRTDARAEAYATLTTLVDDPTDGRTAPVATVVWGLAADPAMRQVELRGLSDSPRSLDLGEPRGAFVVPAGPRARADEVDASFDDGELVSLDYGPSFDGGGPGLVEGTSRLEVRAPDPAGGPAWGAVTTRSKDSGWCVGRPARIAGDRPGSVNLELGTFTEARVPSELTCSSPRLTREEPLELTSTVCGGGVGPAEPSFGRTALRTLPGTCTLSGIAHPDVRLVTIGTERSVRTVAPSPRARAFLTVFDGAFPAGPIEVIATMADGSTVAQQVDTNF